MSNKLKKKTRPVDTSTKGDSVFKEARDNMNKDLGKFMPGFLSKTGQGKKKKLWVLVVVTIVELLVLGAAGKLLYDWFIS